MLHFCLAITFKRTGAKNRGESRGLASKVARLVMPVDHTGPNTLYMHLKQIVHQHNRHQQFSP